MKGSIQLDGRRGLAFFVLGEQGEWSALRRNAHLGSRLYRGNGAL
jgi:hypothetical protein